MKSTTSEKENSDVPRKMASLVFVLPANQNLKKGTCASAPHEALVDYISEACQLRGKGVLRGESDQRLERPKVEFGQHGSSGGTEFA